LSLVVVTVWLVRTKRPYLFVAVPMVAVLGIAGAAMVFNLGTYLHAGNDLLLGIGTLLLALEVWVIIEGVAALRRARAAVASETQADA
jgi:carbon starvation protein